jgi:hypothetical protein
MAAPGTDMTTMRQRSTSVSMRSRSLSMRGGHPPPSSGNGGVSQLPAVSEGVGGEQESPGALVQPQPHRTTPHAADRSGHGHSRARSRSSLSTSMQKDPLTVEQAALMAQSHFRGLRARSQVRPD